MRAWEVVMRYVVVLVLALSFLFAGAPVNAQTATTEPAAPATSPAGTACRRFDTPPLVIVTMRNGSRLRGTLTCLGDELELATGGRLSRTPLEAVAKIAEPRDSMWDGAVIGAGVGAFVWALCGRDCDSGYMARATLDYALLGLVIDAATRHNKTIYTGNARPALSFRVRF